MMAYEKTQEELAEGMRQFMQEANNAQMEVGRVLIHFPDLLFRTIAGITGYSPSYVEEIYAKIKKDTGWDRKKVDSGFTLTLRDDFPIDRAKVERYLPEADSPAGYLYVKNNRLRADDPRDRLNMIGMQVLAMRYPDHVTRGYRLRKTLNDCVCNMHHQELEYWIRYLAQDDCEVYNIDAHISVEPFDPRMIYPRITQEVASQLVQKVRYHRNFPFFSLLNEATPEKQFRMIYPPVQVGRYNQYPRPANQFELAGFKESQIADREYLVGKLSPSATDRRSTLLNCITIVQQNFERGEGGSQCVRRLLGNFLEVVRRGDEQEIQLWLDALIKATLVPQLTLEDIDYNLYRRLSYKHGKKKHVNFDKQRKKREKE